MKTSTLVLILGGGALALWLFQRSRVAAKTPPAASVNGPGSSSGLWGWLGQLSAAGISRLGGGGSGGNSTPGMQPDGSYDISGSRGEDSDASTWITDESLLA